MEYDMTIQNTDIGLYQCTLSLGKRKEMFKKKKKGYYFKYYEKYVLIIFIHNCDLQLVPFFSW